MYSNKENINILTSLLVEHGVYHAVVCPGSRNAPIVHNLNECADITCYAVTDERSAGFIALGLAQSSGLPVAVCVTSGSALLNLLPAVAEAKYQYVPLIVISADRPAEWIDQLDGQTLRQHDALRPFVRRSVTLPEPGDAESRWHCNRLVNEVLLDYKYPIPAPVHINVPVSEPLFEFTVDALPRERFISRYLSTDGRDILTPKIFYEAARPMIIVGQHFSEWIEKDSSDDKAMCRFFQDYSVVLSEPLNNLFDSVPVDVALSVIGDDPAYRPDVVVYLGGHLVSKRLKRFLRQSDAQVIMVSEDPQIHDVTMHMTHLVMMQPYDALRSLHRFYVHNTYADVFGDGEEAGDSEPFYQYNPAHKDYRRLWEKVLSRAGQGILSFEPAYSQMAAVRYFEEQLTDMEYDCQLVCGNSSAVRLVCLYASLYDSRHVWCNRGVNGIEGTLSTAVGIALGSETAEKVFCIIGDLSFFYDQNALWNRHLGGNLRILLLNNGGGGIFRSLPGLEQSPARDSLVTGEHHTSAQGICTQCDVGYLRATNSEEMQMGIVRLLTEETTRPIVLEVFTDSDVDREQWANLAVKTAELVKKHS